MAEAAQAFAGDMAAEPHRNLPPSWFDKLPEAWREQLDEQRRLFQAGKNRHTVVAIYESAVRNFGVPVGLSAFYLWIKRSVSAQAEPPGPRRAEHGHESQARPGGRGRRTV